MRLTKNTSNGFRIANLFATVLVIAIHYNSKYHIPLNKIHSLNYLVQEYLTNGLARIAVPFFALSAGLFFFHNYSDISSYKIKIHKRIRTLLTPYLIACVIILISDFILTTVIHHEPLNQPLSTYILKGFLHPVSVQFWFLRDLMILIIISPIIFTLVKYSKGAIIIIFGTCWFFEIALTPYFMGWYLINIETLFFFSLGCLLASSGNNWQNYINAMKPKTMLLYFLLYSGAMAARVYLMPTFNTWHSTNYSIPSLILHKLSILIGLTFLLAISCKTKSNKLTYISGFTFFVYIYHLFPFSKIITKLGNQIIDDEHLFYFSFPASTVMVFIIAFLLNKHAKPIYNILSGSRGPIQ